jgi:hypothetical protein
MTLKECRRRRGSTRPSCYGHLRLRARGRVRRERQVLAVVDCRRDIRWSSPPLRRFPSPTRMNLPFWHRRTSHPCTGVLLLHLGVHGGRVRDQPVCAILASRYVSETASLRMPLLQTPCSLLPPLMPLRGQASTSASGAFYVRKERKSDKGHRGDIADPYNGRITTLPTSGTGRLPLPTLP